MSFAGIFPFQWTMHQRLLKFLGRMLTSLSWIIKMVTNMYQYIGTHGNILAYIGKGNIMFLLCYHLGGKTVQ